ncbi:DNA damage-regulated autophagy modulator protein 1 [Pholidichthys leucotaenia]
MLWLRQGLVALPVFLIIFSSATFIISYVIAILKGDVDVVFPYISDTGVTPPERCIFSLMTFISACAGIATIYARYKYVERLTVDTSVVKPWCNTVGLVSGMITCFGMCVVASFQETEVEEVHVTGAVIFFLFGVVYVVVQTIISYQVYPDGSSLTVCRIRLVITMIAIVAFFPTVVCAAFVNQTKVHRHKEDKDYIYHFVSAVFEWIAAFSFIFYFYTFIPDFKLFSLRVATEFVG